MADLVVDYDLLTELARSLTFVDVSDDIYSAMNIFQHNWRAHRAKLESAIDAFADG